MGLSWPVRRRRLAAIGAIAAGVVLLLVLLLLVLRPGAQPPAGAAGQTVWQAIESQVTGEDVPVATALEAFAYLTGLEIPRVQVPRGEKGDDAPTSATGALRWVRAHWEQVAPDQQAAIEGFLGPHEGDLVLPVTGHDGGRAGGSRVASAAGGVPAGLVPERIGGDAPSTTVAEAIRADVFATITHLGQKLGLPAIREGLFLKDVTLTLAAGDDGDVFWLTEALIGPNGYSPCNLTVYHHLWSTEAPGQPLTALMHVTLTHEIVHCYQNAVIGDVDTDRSIPRWIMEGSAIWLAGNDTGIVEPMTPGMYRTHIVGKPERALTARSYDAYGWYALLDHLGHPMWSRMGDAWRAAGQASGTGRSEAFIAVLDGDADDVERAWAPAFARESSWNDPWVTYGLGLPADAVAPRAPVRATGAGYLASLPDRSNSLATVTGSDGEIVLVETDGLASVHDGALDSALAFSSHRFCVDGDCICPPGTERAGEQVADSEMHLPFVVAFQSPAGGAGQRISSRTLEKECGRTDSPAPSSSPRSSGPPPVAGGHRPPRCGTRCPGSNGDPHLRTVDGVAYDFQAAGEFTLLRTPDGSVEVQVRQEPATGVELGRVSNNTALAIRLADHRIEVDATATGFDVRVDGVMRSATDPLEIGGGHLERHSGGVQVVLPDGTSVWAIAQPPYGIHVVVDPSADLAASAVGLLGRSAAGLGVPRLPDGTALPKPLDRHEAYDALYRRFADAWRLTDATTLFSYEAGKTTATYEIAGYPATPKVATLTELAPRDVAKGRAACAAIADADLRDQCAYDVVVSGDPGYVRPYVAIGRVAEEGSAALEPAAGQPPANAPAEVLPVLHRLAGSALGPDGTLFVSAVLAARTGLVVAIDPLTGEVLRQLAVAGAGEVAFAAGSVWVAELERPDGTAGPCSITRLDPATLAVVAIVPTACHGIGLGTDLAAVGGDVWFVDPAATDATGASARLRRIDPVTNGVAAASVPLPFPGGVLRASATSLFYGDPAKGQFRLRPGETALARIGDPGTDAFPTGWPAGDALWAVAGSGLARYSTATGPDGTLDLNDADGGILVAADAQSVLIERASATGGNELWRRYLDDRVPVRLASVATAETGLGRQSLLYLDEGAASLLVGETVVVKVWVLVSRTDPAESLLLVQGARLPQR